MTASNSDRYRAAIDRFNAGDLDGYLDLYSENVAFGDISPEPMDKDAVRAFHEQFVSAFPGAQVSVADPVESGDKLAARPVFALRHEGEFMGGLRHRPGRHLRDHDDPDDARRPLRRALVDRRHVRTDDAARGDTRAGVVTPRRRSASALGRIRRFGRRRAVTRRARSTRRRA